jgi:protein ImuB
LPALPLEAFCASLAAGVRRAPQARAVVAARPAPPGTRQRRRSASAAAPRHAPRHRAGLVPDLLLAGCRAWACASTQALADLRALPRAGLARRFGEDLLDELDRARGPARPDPRRWLLLPPERLRGLPREPAWSCYARADTTDQVLHGAGVLLARLVAWAQARHGARGRLHAAHAARAPAPGPRPSPRPPSCTWRWPSRRSTPPTCRLLRERLARTTLAAPTLELQLLCRDLVPHRPPTASCLPPGTAQAEGLTRLLERLRARLGDEQVQRLQPVADHRPERASRAACRRRACRAGAGGRPVPPCGRGRRCRPARPGRRCPLHRPAWLLPEPLPLAERAALPLLHGRPLQLVSGPERIETGWWDGDPVARDYFIARPTACPQTAQGLVTQPLGRGRPPSLSPPTWARAPKARAWCCACATKPAAT